MYSIKKKKDASLAIFEWRADFLFKLRLMGINADWLKYRKWDKTPDALFAPFSGIKYQNKEEDENYKVLEGFENDDREESRSRYHQYHQEINKLEKKGKRISKMLIFWRK